MGYNIIVLSEKQNVRQLNIGSDNLPMKVKCHIASSFHDGIYQVMRHKYDLIIITVLQSMEFTKQAIEVIRRLKNTPILAVIPFLVEWKGQYIKAGADQVLWETIFREAQTYSDNRDDKNSSL